MIIDRNNLFVVYGFGLRGSGNMNVVVSVPAVVDATYSEWLMRGSFVSPHFPPISGYLYVHHKHINGGGHVVVLDAPVQWLVYFRLLLE